MATTYRDNGQTLYSGTEAERLAYTIETSDTYEKNVFWLEPNGNEYRVIEGAWVKIKTAGAEKVSGLAGNPIRISAGETYITNPVRGFRILLKGTGDLSFIADFTGATTETITAAELAEMSTAIYHDWPIPCSSITAGTGMEILAYI